MNAKILIFSVVAMLLLSACDQKNNYVKSSSPLHAILENPTRLTQDKAAEAKATDYILTELPRGSSEAAVSQFISKHLTKAQPKRAAYEFPEPYICVRTYEWSSFPAGGGGTEIVFLLDRSRRLTDVKVYSEMTTL